MTDNIEQFKGGMDAAIDRTHNAVVHATDRAESGIESVAKRVLKGAHAAGEQVRGGADKASQGAHRSLEGAVKAVDRGYSSARSDLAKAAEAATEYVTENPGKTVLLAASTGFALGLLVSRRQPAE